jgi:hypothetical protein
MGRRDYGRHETKKPKKDAKKPIVATVNPLPAPPPVEVVKKKRKQEEEPEEE